MPDNSDNRPAARPIRIGDTAPDFIARSTAGPVRLSDYRGRWLLFFSHPGDFTLSAPANFWPSHAQPIASPRLIARYSPIRSTAFFAPCMDPRAA